MCPTDAIKLALADDAEFAHRVADEGLERYRDGLGTKPRVYYRNLHRWDEGLRRLHASCYGDTDECGAGATLTVELDGAVVGAATGDVFGEALVDRLEPGKEYTLRVEAPGYRPAGLKVTAEASVNAGTVVLEKA